MSKPFANQDYKAAGQHLSGLAIDLAIEVAAPVAGTGLSAIKAVDKLAALKKVEKIAEAAETADVVATIGYRLEFYDNAGKPLRWRNPLTNQVENIPPGMVLHEDHILPKAAFEKIPGFNLLSPAQQKILLEDPRNFRPLDGQMNCSKWCYVEDTDGGWMTYKGQPINADYKIWLGKQQKDMTDYFTEKVEKIRSGGGG
ncbi:hypothetical protein J2X72_003052 [Phyllobacterium sp. 1468]|uniref:hypothetical protein n=1 Tax=Phyllobacterium sp. 1468 TaxID=2817759 RepID=UPI00285BB229|nr:hypothetical protein [Phyllobacterium sp. 1468]MDR6634242.1 hypothetical protein [Phyllobacterium sp. 1468]